METATITESGGSQVIHLPAGFRIAAPVVNVWRDGDRIVLEPPAAGARITAEFLESIRIDDPGFARPEQPPAPPIKEW